MAPGSQTPLMQLPERQPWPLLHTAPVPPAPAGGAQVPDWQRPERQPLLALQAEPLPPGLHTPWMHEPERHWLAP